MGWYFNCKPCFDEMDFWQFLRKYEDLRGRVEKKNSNTLEMFKAFGNLFSGGKK